MIGAASGGPEDTSRAAAVYRRFQLGTEFHLRDCKIHAVEAFWTFFTSESD